MYSNGDFFEGSFKEGQIEGEGTLRCRNGLEYIGHWKHSQVGVTCERYIIYNCITRACRHEQHLQHFYTSHMCFLAECTGIHVSIVELVLTWTCSVYCVDHVYVSM